MEECRTVAKYILLSSFIALACCAKDSTTIAPPNLLNIVDDVIPDVENSTQKVIRVNTVDLPPIIEDEKNGTDSSLYKIQSLLPPPTYLSSKKFRKPPSTIQAVGDSPIIRSPNPDLRLFKPKRPKQKHLHLLYNQQGYDGKSTSKRMKVRVAPGAYPIYYILAKTNGQFRKQPIKGFRNEQELEKYFEKAKKMDKFNTISR